MKNRIFLSRSCPSSEEWQALLRKDLPAARITEMEAHLDGCLLCPAVLDALTPSLPEELWDAVRRPDPTPAGLPEFWRRWADVRPPSEPPDLEPLPFESTGEYRSEGRIGLGGMGEVYRAWEVALERYVAIKILPSGSRRSPDAVSRLKDEALRLAKLVHENIVRVYAADEQDGVPFFAMELVTGSTLAEEIRKGLPQPRRAAELARLIAAATHYAHAAGIFHLDLKPGNILLTTDGTPKIGDFGLARTFGVPTTHSAAKGAGTDEYMAPEQWEGDRESLRERTDVYGLGAILYELLTGRAPFPRSKDRNETKRRVLFDEPTRPRALRNKVPRDLELICLRCLRKRPEDRYATAKELSDALGRFLNGYPIGDCSRLTRLAYLVRRHRTLTGAAFAGLLLLTSVAGLFASARWRHQRIEALNVFETGRQRVAEGRISEGHYLMRSAIDLLPFGETDLRGYFTRSITAMRANLNREVARLANQSEILTTVASPDGRYVLLGDSAGVTTLWDLADNTTRVLPARRDRKEITAVAFNKTGTLCGSGGDDGEIIVWDVHSGHLLWDRHLDHKVRCLGFLGDGDRLLTGTVVPADPPLRMWDMFRDGGKELRIGTEEVRPEMAEDLIVSPGGDRFVSVDSTNRCLLWDAGTGQVLLDLSGEVGTASQQERSVRPRTAFAADGSRLAVAGARLTLHDGRTGAVLRQVDAGRWERVHNVGFCDDGGATMVLDTGRATVLRRVTPDMDAWDDVPMDRPGNPSEVAAFAGRGLVLTGRGTKMLRLLQPPPLALPHTDLGADIGTAHVVVSGDATRIATLIRPRWPGSGRRRATMQELNKFFTSQLQVWDGRTLRPLSRIAELPEGHVAGALAYSPAADTLAVGCLARNDHAPVVLGSLTPDGVITFESLGTHRSDVRALAFTPDGGRLITGSLALPGGAPAELACWTIGVRPAPLWRMPYPAAVTAIAVSPDGTRVVVGGMDGVLRLLPIDRPFEVLTTTDVGDKIAAAAFAHHMPLVAVTQFSDRVRVFEVSDTSFVPRPHFDQPGAAFSAVAFGLTDDTLYVKGDGGVQRWDVHVMKPIDPVITVVGGMRDFSLTSRPEGVIAVTNKGQLILRTVSNAGPVSGAVVGPRATPVDRK